jgi:hypothetical protein
MRNPGAANKKTSACAKTISLSNAAQPRLYLAGAIAAQQTRAPMRFCDLLDQQCLLPAERIIIVTQIRLRTDRIRPGLPYRASTTPRHVGQDIKPNGLRCGVPAVSSEFVLPGNLNIVAKLLATGL